MPGLARGSLSPSPTAPELTRASHFHITLLQLPLLPLSSTFKDPCGYIGPTQVIQNNLPLLKSAD